MKPLCDLCGSRHESYQAHVFASNTASNRSASNRIEGLPVRARPSSEVAQKPLYPNRLGDVDAAASKPSEESTHLKQRWDREKYNAYQREYMRKRRGG